MFESIAFDGLKRSKLFGYAAEVEFFQARKSVEFKPGLNILVGANGSGKSTLVRMLAETMCATVGGQTVVSEDTVGRTVDLLGSLAIGRGGSRKPLEDAIGLKVVHDGQPVVFVDPRQMVGFLGSRLSDDFFVEGMTAKLRAARSSHGQVTAQRINSVLAVTSGKAPAPQEAQVRLVRREVNDVWQKALDVVHSRMAGSIEKGQQTLLLDEPEANFSMQWQARLWEHLAQPELAERFQIIVASHSPWCLGIAHANYIEVSPGMIDEVTDVLVRKARGIEQLRKESKPEQESKPRTRSKRTS